MSSLWIVSSSDFSGIDPGGKRLKLSLPQNKNNHLQVYRFLKFEN